MLSVESMIKIQAAGAGEDGRPFPSRFPKVRGALHAPLHIDRGTGLWGIRWRLRPSPKREDPGAFVLLLCKMRKADFLLRMIKGERTQ